MLALLMGRAATLRAIAKHLNLFILENGYANIEFTVLEILDDPLENEQKWKSILGTKNTGPYDGLRLNNN